MELRVDVVSGSKVESDIVLYEQALSRARWAGRVVGCLYTLCNYVAFWNLTWATVVLLGAYVNSLHRTDYFIIFALLLLEATRLASAAFFTTLLTYVPNGGHFQSPHQASAISTQTKRGSFIVRLLSPIFQVLLIIPAFICSAIRSAYIHYPAAADSVNLQISLRIFYTLVLVNAMVSSTMVLVSTAVWMHFDRIYKERSVLKYYDEVLHTTLKKGVVQGNSFSFFDFAFGLLGREYAASSHDRWQTTVDIAIYDGLQLKIVEAHASILRYLYEDKEGADQLLACLRSGDAAVQKAAANVVGLWAYLRGGKVQLPVELMTKLADMVGTGEIGWAALNSLHAVARSNPRFLINTVTSNREPVLHRIVELVDSHHGARSLASIRTLIHLYDRLRQQPALTQSSSYRDVLDSSTVLSSWNLLPKNLETKLANELQYLLQESSVEQQIKVHAAYLLWMLDLHREDIAGFRDHVRNIFGPSYVVVLQPTEANGARPGPKSDEDELSQRVTPVSSSSDNEKQMVEHLLRELSLPPPVQLCPTNIKPSMYKLSIPKSML